MIHYNFAQIDQTSMDIKRSSANINRSLETLKKGLQPMVAEWEGESADAYKAAQARWDRSAAELNRILEEVSRKVTQSNDRMRHINRSAANSWS
ncbi:MULTISPECIES: WXG100 family type VII secretion target [Corynebacterium]|uniref:ESAT-6-like protein n=1 Tax=Corynebacterium auriscanis TaxID=99807 RepID=A0A0A2DLY7_9CORY|nr:MULTISPECIES: WXG100 family type VII secretion target [Corynebacterium]KGM18909.1 secretion protein [Corynebacterium auriscanis]MCX2162790.1 WXG100 family type VII secretion target [Corynebacterium auriscanis]OFT88723.1 secretion protein [Corynebacterium sp. HMSC28B08]WJY73511.1 6 kDa early secretory antigenic target [Corynebacterium auriscanis]